MIAKISTASKIKPIIDYNEKKVAKGEARLIGGENMRSSKEADQLSYEQKLSRFDSIIAGKRNTQHEKVGFHVSLSFDPSEKPSDDTLKAVASTYMDKLGYGNQPFLIYRHEDTHHPHIHIVSTTVDKEGKKINDSNIRYKSEGIRKEIEKEFGLVVAQDKKKLGIDELTPVELAKGVQYGKTEIKKAISDIVRPVVAAFKLTSMKELQAVLGQYNIKAETVSGENKNVKYEGVVFSVTDEGGKRIGTGIKSSELFAKKAMHNLNLRFEHNKDAKKEIGKETVKEIEKVFAAHKSITKEDLQGKLSAKGINLQYHEGKQGVFGITIIDNANKAVFKGSELGKGYSWNNLSGRLSDITVEKTGIAILDKETIGKATSALATIYDKLRKDAAQGAFFESHFIRKLDKVDLATPLLSVKKDLTPFQARELVDTFKAYKTHGLPGIEGAERDYFKKGVEGALRFLYQAPESFSGRDRIGFLHRNNYKVGAENGQPFISHLQGDHLRQNMEADRYRRFIGAVQAESDTSTGKPYSKGEKAFIAAVADGKVTGSELDLFSVHYAHFKPMLSEANARLVEREMTATYYRKLSDALGKTATGATLAGELAKRGLQVVPIIEGGKVKEYNVQYYAFPESKIPVDAALRGQLRAEGYSNMPPADITKYRLLVDLHQSRDRRDAYGIDRTLQRVEKINPGFADTLKKELAPFGQMIAKGDSGTKDRLLTTMINTLIDHINRYGNDTMREMKVSEGAVKADLSGIRMDTTGKEYEEKAKTNTTFADAFSGTNESGGPEQDPKKNKGKKFKR